MKLKSLRLLVLAALILPFCMHAQDIHVTQFQSVPLSINPAQSGGFEGTYRVSALYRAQWLGGVKNGYQTPIMHVDVPISGFRKQDWIGIGLNLHQDKAAASVLTNSALGLALAYHVGLDKKNISVFSIGLQGGMTQRRINRDVLRFQDQITSGTQSADLPRIDANGKTYVDFNLGVNYRTKIGKKTGLNLGAAVEHLAQPKYNLITSTVSNLPRRFNVYGALDLPLTKRISLQPAAIVRSTLKNTETMVQTLGTLKLDEKKNTSVNLGLGYRLGDAVQVLAGGTFNTWRVGLAYDVTASDLRSNSSAKDGFEISVGYIGRIFKTPTPPAVILCPRY
jgi:type IX secretion system PorP/SprF family membrane protein